MDALILESTDKLQAGPVTDVTEAAIGMSAEGALHDLSLRRPIEQRAPSLQLVHTLRCFFREELDHPPVVDVLAAKHRIGKVHLPVVRRVEIPERGGDATFRHNGVSLAEERFT